MFVYTPNTVPNTVVVVGAGGTGGRLIPLLAQFLKTMPWVIDPAIILVDDDVVEEKNLLRQNFIKTDVGKPKAVVLAERYSRAFNINIIPVVRRINGGTDDYTAIFKDREGDNGTPIVVMCVDSANARRNILKAFSGMNRSGRVLYVDSGNEDSYGQVTVFNPVALTHDYVEMPSLADELKRYSLPEMLPIQVKAPYLFMDVDFYETLQDKPGGSCADLDQTLAINSMMATTIIGVIQNYYYVKPFNTNRINLTVAQGGSGSIMDARNLYNRVLDYTKGRNFIGAYSNYGLHSYRWETLLNLTYSNYSRFLADLELKRRAEEEARIKAEAEARLKAEAEGIAVPVDVPEPKLTKKVRTKRSPLIIQEPVDISLSLSNIDITAAENWTRIVEST